jgi:DNA-directed RNA polymerase subunit RPC12/RpoP
MSEFKYACPVCGQHIKCDSSQVGTQMECPTCFQKITVPQAPATDEQKLIITGSKPGERPAPTIPDGGFSSSPTAKGFPGVTVVLIILVFIAAAVGFVYRGTIFKSNPPAPTNSAGAPQQTSGMSSSPQFVAVVPTNLPMLVGTNYWTLNVNAVGTPNVPAGGKVHGKFFTAQVTILNEDGLTIRTADNPPEAGVTIYLRPNPIESLFGKSVVIQTNFGGAPLVNLRWKDAQGQAMQESEGEGYALRIQFGQAVSNYISGKIYLCTPDELKSYIVGNFNAEIVKPKPAQ